MSDDNNEPPGMAGTFTVLQGKLADVQRALDETRHQVAVDIRFLETKIGWHNALLDEIEALETDESIDVKLIVALVKRKRPAR